MHKSHKLNLSGALIILILTAFSISSCNTSSTPQSPPTVVPTTAEEIKLTATAVTTVESAYPAPQNNDEPGYPIPTLILPEPGSITAPDPMMDESTGAFRTRLFYTDNSPIKRQIFYVAELLPVTGELQGAFVPALDPEIAPRGESDDNGVIVISSIPSGKYVLAIMTPFGPILVLQPNEEEIFIEINSGILTEIPDQRVLLNREEFEP